MPTLTASFMKKLHQHAENRREAKKPRIFFDIDGVLGDFEGHAKRENKFTADGKLKYDALDYNWWMTMPAYPGAKAFYDKASQLGATNFLTGPALSTGCFEGKADWVQKFVPEQGSSILNDLIICRSEKKFLVAAPGRILVDDNTDNIKAWRDAGGIGIHHTGKYEETLKQVEEAVVKITKPSPAKKLANKLRVPKLSCSA